MMNRIVESSPVEMPIRAFAVKLMLLRLFQIGLLLALGLGTYFS